MVDIPHALREHIDSAYPEHVCTVGTLQPNGFVQVTPRGSVMVFDDDNLAIWERGRGSTTDNMKDGDKVTVFFRKGSIREILPKGGIARFYGVAEILKSGPVYEEVWERLVPPEKERDPDKKGWAVIIKLERAEQLDGSPLSSN